MKNNAKLNTKSDCLFYLNTKFNNHKQHNNDLLLSVYCQHGGA